MVVLVFFKFGISLLLPLELVHSVHRMAKSDCTRAASDVVVGITEVKQCPVSTWMGDCLGTPGLWLAGFEPTAQKQAIEMEQLYI